MKKYRIPKSSFLYQFSMRFLLLILLPVIAGWMIFMQAMNYFYADNLLTAQQISMEKSLASLETSLNAASNAVTALESNTEIVYYLDYYSNKPEMLYSLEKNIRSFCASLYSMSPYLSSIRIYSDSPILLYAEPFEKLENLPLEDESLDTLFHLKPQQSVWTVSLDDTQQFPTIYRYQKFYAYHYSKTIGYIEIQLSPDIFQDYFELLEDLIGSTDAALTLYYQDQPIYSTKEDAADPISYNDTENGCQIEWLHNTYINCLKIPTLNFVLICSGQLSSLNAANGNIVLFIISGAIILLLILIIIFFSSVTSLSLRILNFSSFIRHSDTDNLMPYHPDAKYANRSDELALLIKTYNEMITENTSLISKVQKMELLSQNARYQALQAQIHPHFIYGTLETIRMTALQNKDKEAASMIFSLSALIRYSISISSESVTLKDEVDIASHYLNIQKIRFDERLDYTFSVEESLLAVRVPAFILQPILENAIIYGVSQTLDACRLLISISASQQDLILKVSNTGAPITPERLSEVNELLDGIRKPENFHGNQNGMALSNIRERLMIFFHGNASICMTREDSYTNTIITIYNCLNAPKEEK